ncbi:MAG: TrkH family potassium uptake protein [Firmicutes bacterium]|nr:TrkH family potassium uptake protein [Bacillota bacterium]MDY5855749.1 TrkH family potassium uptake protein [Anaerovoracaceae bacterium]
MRLNYPVILKVTGLLTLIEGIAMVPCILAALVFEEWNAASALIPVCLICVCVGFVILTQLKFKKIRLKLQETFLIACLSWVYCSLIGMIPYYFSSCGFTLMGSFFESVAGFTTTGCTVLDPNLLPLSLQLWRAICHWLGGMGILILVLTIFPMLGIGGQFIMSAEAPGPAFERLGMKISEAGKYLYGIYLLLTAAEFALLALGPMDVFTALCASLSSISTAGLIITDANAVYFQSTYVRLVIMLFTILSAMSYLIYYMILKGRWRDALKNLEARAFLLTILVSSALISVVLKCSGTYSSLWQAVKDSLCQVVSMISTSGYFVCNYMDWPTFTQVVLFFLMIVGGCSASTSGSLKILRFIVMLKLVKRGIFRRIHPHAVKPVMLDGRPVSAPLASSITMHILLYFGVLIIGSVLLSFNNLDMETTITSALGAFSNTGMALGQVGATGYFGMFSGFSLFVLTILMIAGRLEMYAIILLFTPSFWHPDKVRAV